MGGPEARLEFIPEMTRMIGHSSAYRTVPLAILFLLTLSGLLQVNGGIKVIDTMVVDGVNYPDEPIVKMVMDIDQRLWDDLLVAYPDSDINGTDSGELQIFWGEGSPLMDLRREKADVRIVGSPGWRLGASVESWDFNGNEWNDLVIGCPGAGKVLLYDSLKLAIQVHGATLLDSQADMALSKPGTVDFGCAVCAGDFTGEGVPDLLALSGKDATIDPTVTVYLGGVDPERGLTFPLPKSSVDDRTQVTHLDIMGQGREALVFSAPDRSAMRWLYVNVTETPIPLAGGDPDGVVRFTGNIASTGNTFGWGQADDGWDTSAAHVYDSLAGAASVRYNQATGNALGYDRSVSHVNQLQIELGGIPATGDDMSGAYGISFAVTPEMLVGADSVILHFDYTYEDWGFENSERMWVKARFWDHDGTVTWLGRAMDGAPEPDATNEVFTLRGQNAGGTGINLAGSGRYSNEVIDLFDGAGNYYLDMGGKISMWTTAGECGSVGFDNVSMVIRQISVYMKTVTGSGGMGATLHVQDVDLDGFDDLLAAAPLEGKVRVFKGHDSYWATLSGINAAQCNTTIEGTPGQSFGDSMVYMPQTHYSFFPSILVTDPLNPAQGRNGTLYHYICPLPAGQVGFDRTRDIYNAPEGTGYFGITAFYVDDRDSDYYQEWRVLSWSEQGNLTVSKVDSSPYPPDLKLLYPKVTMEVHGTIEIRVQVYDHDGDCVPTKLKTYRSIDNRTWIYLGDVDRMEGDVAVKVWDTNKFENGRHFLKFTLEDEFGLERNLYSNWIEVLNHRPPVVELAFPIDGATLSNTVSVAAKTTIASGDNLSSPVTFYYSRDGVGWSVLAEKDVPPDHPSLPPVLSREFLVELNTTTMDDGPVWFRVNATTDFGLGTESRNVDPAFIDNIYVPTVKFLSLSSGSNVSGEFDLQFNISDRDEDIIWPVSLEFRSAGMDYEPFAELELNDTNYLWDTYDFENGVYDLSLLVKDQSHNEVREELTDINIHNLYTPTVAFDGMGDGEVVRGSVKVIASITDRDFNIVNSGVSFSYRHDPGGEWTTIPGSYLRRPYADVLWDTTLLKNGRYDLKARVVDLDGLVGEVVLNEVLVDNFYAPKVYPYEIPPIGSSVSGVVTITFNISDDEPVDPGSISVEVFAKGSWERLDDPELLPDQSFVPEGNMTYEVVWDTLEKGIGGLRRFPDYQGYHLKINVTDADGQIGTWETPKSYTVRNEADETGGFLSGPGGRWIMATAFFVLLFLVLAGILVFFLFFAEGKRKVEEPAEPPRLVIPPPPPPAPAKVEAPSAADIFAPVTGTGEPQPTGPSKEELEEAFSAISMAQEPSPGPATPAPRPKREHKRIDKRKGRVSMDIASVMPQKALPRKLREEKWDSEVEEFEEWEE